MVNQPRLPISIFHTPCEHPDALRCPAHNATLLPPVQLLLDALRGILSAHRPRRRIHFREEAGQMAHRIRLGLPGHRHIRL